MNRIRRFKQFCIKWWFIQTLNKHCEFALSSACMNCLMERFYAEMVSNAAMDLMVFYRNDDSISKRTFVSNRRDILHSLYISNWLPGLG